MVILDRKKKARSSRSDTLEIWYLGNCKFRVCHRPAATTLPLYCYEREWYFCMHELLPRDSGVVTILALYLGATPSGLELGQWGRLLSDIPQTLYIIRWHGN